MSEQKVKRGIVATLRPGIRARQLARKGPRTFFFATTQQSAVEMGMLGMGFKSSDYFLTYGVLVAEGSAS